MKRYIKRFKTEIIVALVLLIFPLIVGAFYALPIPQYILVDAGDLLSFYGVAFGLFGTYVSYAESRKKERRTRNAELKPNLRVDLRLVDIDDKIYRLIVYNNTTQPLYSVFLYDCFVGETLSAKEEIFVTYEGARVKEYNGKKLFNVDLGDEGLDREGYPTYIQICCDDAKKRMWDCTFDARGKGEDRFYYPRNFEII